MNDAMQKEKDYLCIGIVDICGFETFKVSSLKLILDYFPVLRQHYVQLIARSYRVFSNLSFQITLSFYSSIQKHSELNTCTHVDMSWTNYQKLLNSNSRASIQNKRHFPCRTQINNPASTAFKEMAVPMLFLLTKKMQVNLYCRGVAIVIRQFLRYSNKK